ncbi:hypothetical protein CO057_02605 [Candidatus Uhrbacteria bacterium CG_4_9_14_0_2_um_filter_41_50]|uniref:Uncharacterized protein n=1 Tax=Candidatus Uhrbacteria bacterium CG_4_9_14_0_2_um_filter_41_50 TaxID=1975031 RepID=A0A2M8ENZ0_9BACT|nr:MAG: hypothetical protein COZ45_00240 [Candidatus Uhrbacteria bacterium CG_4_10_14_3_um_filter_41_21]PIZ55336.1 MAG: hypothetical protein COY24_00710 [Candidatus Uhrbacteria bacterium CG_4_10_14_0_2_um_filter_41_21]PJB84559.1 MAG: hypothetical protein CO086_02885 [Candidatus Uhrbacteria bacterium CG_4_9_14_0_8_um_filter_41_16]PJC24463.1 MAG: hypothetical protein CO057_02605 [Candidatus Uhrbacteria bacterium CG_4_9_14_0_2_um_filter_41_50]PJE75413.1 MAG: hypothetical protein COV03_00180 [Candi
MKGGNKRLFIGIFAALIIMLALISVFALFIFRSHNLEYGATFSPKYAQYLGLDWQTVFKDSVSDLEIHKYRIPVYWSDIEYADDQYDFERLDWIMNYAEENNLLITLAIGVKVPRWPECYAPSWADSFTDYNFDKSAIDFLAVIVNRYKDYESLERWQVENEPYFPFGECRAPSPERILSEITVVNNLDGNHPIQQTTSGEQSFWALQTSDTDVLGVSLYREAWSYATGEFVFPFSPMFYSVQRVLAEMFVDKVIISELQAEPWLSSTTFENTTESIDDYYNRFSAEDLVTNIRFAKRTGAREVYFWGIEWWYYLKDRGDTRLWEAGSQIINQ